MHQGTRRQALLFPPQEAGTVSGTDRVTWGLVVTDCNRNGSGLQSTHFLDHILRIYPRPQDHIICISDCNHRPGTAIHRRQDHIICNCTDA